MRIYMDNILQYIADTINAYLERQRQKEIERQKALELYLKLELITEDVIAKLVAEILQPIYNKNKQE